MYKRVYFDLDDTILGTLGPKLQQHRLAHRLLEKGELLLEDFFHHWGEPLREMIRNLYNCKSDEELDHDSAFYHSLSDGFPKTILPGRLELLELLVSRGIPFGIITATNKANLVEDLSLLGFDLNMFHHLQGADETEFHKPDGRVFDGLLAELAAEGISASEVLYIGDGMKDMQAALSAGMGFVGLPNGITTHVKDFIEHGVQAFDDIDDLIAFIKENTEASSELKFQ